MKRYRVLSSKKVTLVALLTLALVCNPVLAKSPVKLQQWIGAIDLSADNPLPFELAGTASHLGQFTAYGEVEFMPGEEDGTQIGLGVVVFEAADGDLLVGNVTWDVDEAEDGLATSAIHFSWADSVQFSNEMIVENTGRFVEDRPPGLVVTAIIAIIIGLLLPAVKQVRAAAAR